MWSEVMERGNLRQTGRFWAQREADRHRRTGSMDWDRMGKRQKSSGWPQIVQDKRGARRAGRRVGSEDEGEQFAPKELI